MFLQDMCSLCLSPSSEALNNLRFTKGKDNLSNFDKISSSLIRLLVVINTDYDYLICMKCSETVDMIYKFNESCLRNIKKLTAFKIALKDLLSNQSDDHNSELDEIQKLQTNRKILIDTENLVTNFSINDGAIDEDYIALTEALNIKKSLEENEDEDYDVMTYENQPIVENQINVTEPNCETEIHVSEQDIKSEYFEGVEEIVTDYVHEYSDLNEEVYIPDHSTFIQNAQPLMLIDNETIYFNSSVQETIFSNIYQTQITPPTNQKIEVIATSELNEIASTTETIQLRTTETNEVTNIETINPGATTSETKKLSEKKNLLKNTPETTIQLSTSKVDECKMKNKEIIKLLTSKTKEFQEETPNDRADECPNNNMVNQGFLQLTKELQGTEIFLEPNSEDPSNVDELNNIVSSKKPKSPGTKLISLIAELSKRTVKKKPKRRTKIKTIQTKDETEAPNKQKIPNKRKRVSNQKRTKRNTKSDFIVDLSNGTKKTRRKLRTNGVENLPNKKSKRKLNNIDNDEEEVLNKEVVTIVKPKRRRRNTKHDINELENETIRNENEIIQIVNNESSNFFVDERFMEEPTFEEEFLEPSIYNEHNYSEDKVRKKWFDCKICGKMFSESYNLDVHIRIHSGYKSYPCTVCSQTFPRKKSLAAHMYFHTDNIYMCDVCYASYHSKSLFIQHMMYIHGRELLQNESYKCGECFEIFDEKSTFDKHNCETNEKKSKSENSKNEINCPTLKKIDPNHTPNYKITMISPMQNI